MKKREKNRIHKAHRKHKVDGRNRCEQVNIYSQCKLVEYSVK